MTHILDAAEASALSAFAIPVDTSKSRLQKATRPDGADEEIVRAADRFAAFRRKYKDGFVDTDLERVIEHPDGHVTYVIRANVWKGEAEGRPDASAWAQGSTRDANQIIAGAPLESADTIARSRALRNLGILAVPRKPDAPAPTTAPTEKVQAVDSDVAVARRASGLTQADLAKQMREAGLPWTQAVVSKVERERRGVTEPEAATLTVLIGYQPK